MRFQFIMESNRSKRRDKMKANRFFKRILIGFMVVMLVPFGALSRTNVQAAATFSEAELDQMLAPIALYPDSLLAQVLIAATYQADIITADRWVTENSSLKGAALDDALKNLQWDESVKALAAFPQVLAMMAKESAWVQRLGQAFMTQESDVTASIQKLRAKAMEAGSPKWSGAWIATNRTGSVPRDFWPPSACSSRWWKSSWRRGTGTEQPSPKSLRIIAL